MKKVFYACNGTIALPYSTKGMMASVCMIGSIFTLYVLSMILGSYDISIEQVFHTLLGNNTDKTHDMIVWSFRMPRALVALLVGAMLALSGATLQTLTRNSLADPSLVGISEGASLAVVSMIVLFPEWPDHYRPFVGFTGAITVALLIQLLSMQAKSISALKFILIGIGISAFIGSITSVILTYGDVRTVMSAMNWLVGSINSVNWKDVLYLSIALVMITPLLFLVSRVMQIMLLGDDITVAFGVNIRRTKTLLIILSVGLAGVAVASVGPLGFVGLLAPHIAKRINTFVGCDGMVMHLFHSACVGGILVMFADLLGRAAFTTQISAGLLLPVIGVPFFVFLLVSKRTR